MMDEHDYLMPCTCLIGRDHAQTPTHSAELTRYFAQPSDLMPAEEHGYVHPTGECGCVEVTR